MNEENMQHHLREYAQNGIEQKIRLSKVLADYRKQKAKTESRIEQENQFISDSLAEGIPQEKIDVMIKRAKEDGKVFEKVSRYIGDSETQVEELVNSIKIHLEKLSELDINANGFMVHPIGVDQGAELDKENMTASMRYEGHVEMPIGIKQHQWEDRSKLTIVKINEGGA